MKLKCQCCGIEREFKDGEEAFQEGWDAPPHFSYVACNLCPGICAVMKMGHSGAHDLWAKEGRPQRFTIGKCGIDKDIQ